MWSSQSSVFNLAIVMSSLDIIIFYKGMAFFILLPFQWYGAVFLGHRTGLQVWKMSNCRTEKNTGLWGCIIGLTENSLSYWSLSHVLLPVWTLYLVTLWSYFDYLAQLSSIVTFKQYDHKVIFLKIIIHMSCILEMVCNYL